MPGIGGQDIESLNSTATTPVGVILFELLNELHHGVINVGRIVNIKDDVLAGIDVCELAFKANEVRKDRRPVNLDLVSAGVRFVKLVRHLEEILQRDTPKEVNDDLDQDPNQDTD